MTESIKLVAVGDISFGDYAFCPGFGIRSAISRNLSPFKNVLNVLNEGDVVFGNLETVLSNYNLDHKDLNSWEMRGTPSSVSLLKDAGFNVVNLANNHTMQHGREAFLETVNVLLEQRIEVVGLNGTTPNHSKPVILNCNGYTIGFIGYAYEEDIYGNDKTEYAFGPLCNIEEDIKTLRNQVQILIVSCHWGLEFMTVPSPNTINLGRKCIDWGADIVLGHHPHVLQGYEYFKKGIIIYSLGNFLFDMMWDDNCRKSAIFIFDINSRKIKLKTIPIYISDDYSVVTMSKKLSLKLSNPCNGINEILRGDLERKTLNYYLEYEKLRKTNRYKSYRYFLKNALKIDKHFCLQIVNRTLSRRFR